MGRSGSSSAALRSTPSSSVRARKQGSEKKTAFVWCVCVCVCTGARVSDGSAIICQDRLRTGFTEARKLLWICKREERCCVAFPACWICAYIGDVELPPLARLRCGQTDATFSDAIYALETIDLPDRETSKKEGRFLCRRLHKSNISTSPLRLEHWNWTLVKFDASRTSSGLRGVMDDGTGRSSLPAAVLLLLPLPENRRADLPEDRPPAGGDRARVAFDLTGVDADIDARLSSNTNPPPLGVRRCAFAGGGPGGGGGGGSPAGDGETAASPPPPLSKLALAPPPSRLFILLILRCRARVVMAVLYSCCFLPEPPFAPPPPGAPTELGFDEATDEASPFAVAKLPFSAVMKLPSPSGSESSVCVREWEKVGTPRSAAILYFVSRRRRRWLLLLYFAATRTSRLRDLSPSKRGLACRRNAPRRPLADDPDFDSPAIDSDGLLTPPSRD